MDERAQPSAEHAARAVLGAVAAARKRAVARALIAGVVVGTSANAHHGFGTFDLRTDIELKGTITGLDFVNPHSWLYLDVPRADGTVASYRCEMRAATVLRRSGWTPEMFVVGAPITIQGSPDRNDPSSCYVATAIFADGSTIDRYGQRVAAVAQPKPAERTLRLPSGEPNITGDWAPEQFVMSDPRGQAGTLVPLSVAPTLAPGEVPEGQQAMRGTRGTEETPTERVGVDASRGPWNTAPVQYTERGQKAADEFDMWTPENPRMRCETTSIVFDWNFDGPVNRITQGDGTITLEYGQYGFTRTIHMNVSEHPASIEPSRAGHSIGRWENDVLVVDTVGFAPGVLAPPVMHGEKLHVVERFELDEEALALTRTYEAEDPDYFVGRYTGSDTILPADLPFAPDPCEELTFVDYATQSRSQPESSDAAAPGVAGTPAADSAAATTAEEPDSAWWEFWKWLD